MRTSLWIATSSLSWSLSVNRADGIWPCWLCDNSESCCGQQRLASVRGFGATSRFRSQKSVLDFGSCLSLSLRICPCLFVYRSGEDSRPAVGGWEDGRYYGWTDRSKMATEMECPGPGNQQVCRGIGNHDEATRHEMDNAKQNTRRTANKQTSQQTTTTTTATGKKENKNPSVGSCCWQCPLPPLPLAFPVRRQR